MAKGYNLKAALKVVNQLGKQMGAEGTADYNVALSALTAGQKNLSKQTRALTRDMLMSQGTNQAALGSLAARARAQSGVVAAHQAGTTSRYGQALGASVAAAYKPAGAVAAGTGQVVTGQAKQGKATGRVGETVAGIAKAGVAAQQAAAEYSLNQALQQRNIIDSQTLASLTGDLYKTAMSYNMQWEMWKKQQQFAEKKAGPEAKSTVSRLINEGSSIAIGAADSIRQYRTENEDDPDMNNFNITTTAQEWAQKNGYDPAGPEATLYMATLRNMTTGEGSNAADAFQTAITTLYSSSPGWDKWGDAMVASGMGAINVDAHRAYMGSLQDGASGDAGAARHAGQTYESVPTKSTKVSLNDLSAARNLPNGNYTSSEGVPFTVDNHQVIVNGSTVY